MMIRWDTKFFAGAINIVSLSIVLCATTTVVGQQGALDFMLPCKKEEAKFKSTAEALNENAKAISKKDASWNNNPNSVPENFLVYYRSALKAYDLKVWSDTPEGKGTIESWQPATPDQISEKFIKFIYQKQVSNEVETKLAKALFQ